MPAAFGYVKYEDAAAPAAVSRCFFYIHFGYYKIEFKIQIHSILVNPNVIEQRSLFVWWNSVAFMIRF